MDWQPIETAPTDTFVLVYMPWTKLVRQGRFNTRGPRQVGWRVSFESSKEAIIYGDPTHWMPLPEAPVSVHRPASTERNSTESERNSD